MKFLLAFLLFLIYSASYSQLCPGSLGDPIINITFGQGNASQGALAPNVTTYQKVGSCPDKGQYTINNFIYGCGGGTWQQTIGDHTRDVDGNYMMVNAESTPGTVYTTTVTELCGNTKYQFAVWVMNVLKQTACNGKPVHPNLILTVATTSGTVLASTTTGDIPETDLKTWNQFGVCFTTPSNINALVLKISTNPAPGCGSAFMIDDITLKTSGPIVNINIDKDTTDVDVCAGYSNPFIFTGKYSVGFNDPVVQWQNSVDSGKTWVDISGATNLTYNMPRRNSGLVKYRMVVAERGNINSAHCKIASLPIGVNVHLLPNQQGNVRKTGCTGQPYQLVDTSFSSSYNLKYNWKGPGGFQSSQTSPTIPNLNFNDSGKYIVTLTTDFGCSQTDTLSLLVVTGSQLSVTPAVSNICSGQKINFTSTGDGTYQWQPATGLSSATIGNPIASLTDSINYLVVLTNPHGCKSTAQVVVNVLKSPFADAGADQTILIGDSVMLNGIVTGTNVIYYWSPPSYMSDPKIINPVVYPPTTTTYTLYALSYAGCGSATSKVTVKVFKDIYIPNAFTPNRDGVNDHFTINAPSNFSLRLFGIYNRAGQQIYKAGAKGVDWDGTFKGEPQPSGVYVYSLQMVAPGSRNIIRKGSFLLIR